MTTISFDTTQLGFLIVMGGAIVFTAMIFIWRGVVWLAFLSAIFWFLFATWSMNYDPIFIYQRELVALWWFIGVAMLLSPLWLKTKDTDIMDNVGGHNDMWGDDSQFSDEAFDRHINSSRRPRRW